MEIFFNLVWMAVSICLGGAWLISRSRASGDDSCLPPIRVQVIALALLAVILFPVISLTDDLQACTAPSEAEHLARRADAPLASDAVSPGLPLALVTLFAPTELAHPFAAGLFPDEVPTLRSLPEYALPVAKRPPPAV